GGAGLFIAIATLGRGYWWPGAISQIIKMTGVVGLIGLALLLCAFNLLLSAGIVGVGVLVGQAWRVIT
ncbi:MAG: hypothetical protein K0M78_14620, partial [Brevundimonas sp.]|nr:hypothetical protein [Brevundimonas sp.]